MSTRGHPFERGHAKIGGRTKGTPNRASVEARKLALRLVSDPDYVTSLERRLKEGKLSPAIEALLWQYAFGKPKEHTPSESLPVKFTLSIPDSPSISPVLLRGATLPGANDDTL